MNTYLCQIDLKKDAQALSFAAALENWLGHLQRAGAIGGWSLSRRKLNLAADRYRDFILQIEVANLAQLDQAFRWVGEQGDEAETLYMRMHDMIDAADCGLFRPFPDPERAERLALI
ncbi:MAG: DUF6614 family protein [Roseovarius sp.]